MNTKADTNTYFAVYAKLVLEAASLRRAEKDIKASGLMVEDKDLMCRDLQYAAISITGMMEDIEHAIKYEIDLEDEWFIEEVKALGL